MPKITLILIAALLLFAACSSCSDTAKQSPGPSAEPAGAKESPAVTQAAVASPDEGKGREAAQPLVTFIELGAESCIPCKMMQPILQEIRTEYQGLVDVVFYDLYKNREAGPQYKVRVMPTQVFLDSEGREFFRHEGYYPKEEIVKMLAEKGGVAKPPAQ